MLKHGLDHPSASDLGSSGLEPTAFARAELGGRLPGSAQAVGFSFSSVRWERFEPFMPVCGRARTFLDSFVSRMLFVIWPPSPSVLVRWERFEPFVPACGRARTSMHHLLQLFCVHHFYDFSQIFTFVFGALAHTAAQESRHH